MFSRDSQLWNILIALFVVIGALSAMDAETLATYGIPAAWLPFLRLVALIGSTLSGVMRWSPAGLSAAGKTRVDGSRVDPARFGGVGPG